MDNRHTIPSSSQKLCRIIKAIAAGLTVSTHAFIFLVFSFSVVSNSNLSSLNGDG